MRRAAAALAACALAATLACATAHAQDARTVQEPRIPALCATIAPQTAGSDTARIQAAMDACKAGMAVRLAPGAYHSGPLTLRSHVTLFVDAGATLYASTNPKDYDLGGGSCGTINQAGHGCREFIGATDTVGSAIIGDGVIDGQGGHAMDGLSESWWQLARRAQKEKANQNVPRLIQLRKVSDFTLYRITLRNSPNFHVAMSGVDGFTAWAVKIDTPADARNTDGIDPGGARNVTVTRSFIRTGDDNIAIKAGNGAPTENVSITHNHFYSGHGMSIGSETVGTVRNVLVDDLTLDGTTAGLRIKSDAGRGGEVAAVRYRNVCMRNVKNAIELNTRYEKRSEGTSIPVYRDIAFEHVASATPSHVMMQGFDAAHPLQVSFSETSIPAAATIDHTQQSGAIVDAAGACDGRFVPFPEPSKPMENS